MSEKIRKALDAASEFVLEHNEFSDDREVRCITPFAGEKPQLTLGDIRILLDLAREGAVLADPFDHGRDYSDDPAMTGRKQRR